MSEQTNKAHDQYSPIEGQIASIWMGVLEHQCDDFPDMNVSFLELGGDSVSAALCISRLRNTFGPAVDIDISDFFQDESTIRNFARGIEGYNSTNVEPFRQSSESIASSSVERGPWISDREA